MKNQFVGDINDYYKYGLLRIFSDVGKKKIGICWMLTPERTEYLHDPGKWRDFDPVLFGELRRIVQARAVRRMVAEGPPEEVTCAKKSFTGQARRPERAPVRIGCEGRIAGI